MYSGSTVPGEVMNRSYFCKEEIPVSDSPSIDQQQLSSALEAKLKQDASAKDVFCKCWPCASDVLQLLLKLPTLPKQVAAALKVIIAVGDKASAAICK